ncbi:hypothetical protein DAEQUDRAFT_766150 [Daedalea quercina L-15889]|uniref:Uncharacterized protein n=1 Tax=Daedalea quercina L-15889 TaxID=1314783 RepID=A0A165PXC1_9APHY|nr:hypothetical protein DAEQUDRAFT_766150 [Daedalea quercina L-15889]
MVSQLLATPHTFIRNLNCNGPLADDPLDALRGMDALAQVFDVAVDLYTQQDLLEDAIHEYANARNQATRTMMLRLRDLEDQVVVQATTHDMVPLHNIQYTRDFVISHTFPHLADEDEQGDYPPRPLTPYPAARLGTTLAEHPTTPIGDSPTGVDENILPWDWTVNDDFEIAHDSASTPPPNVPPPLTAEEQGWIAHWLLTGSPTQEESVEQCADRYRQQLLASEPHPSSGGSETGDILSTGTEEVVAHLTYHRDGMTTFRGVEGS